MSEKVVAKIQIPGISIEVMGTPSDVQNTDRIDLLDDGSSWHVEGKTEPLKSSPAQVAVQGLSRQDRRQHLQRGEELIRQLKSTDTTS